MYDFLTNKSGDPQEILEQLKEELWHHLNARNFEAFGREIKDSKGSQKFVNIEDFYERYSVSPTFDILTLQYQDIQPDEIAVMKTGERIFVLDEQKTPVAMLDFKPQDVKGEMKTLITLITGHVIEDYLYTYKQLQKHYDLIPSNYHLSLIQCLSLGVLILFLKSKTTTYFIQIISADAPKSTKPVLWNEAEMTRRLNELKAHISEHLDEQTYELDHREDDARIVDAYAKLPPFEF